MSDETSKTSALVSWVASYAAQLECARHALLPVPTPEESQAYLRVCAELDRRVPVPPTALAPQNLRESPR